MKAAHALTTYPETVQKAKTNGTASRPMVNYYSHIQLFGVSQREGEKKDYPSAIKAKHGRSIFKTHNY